MSEQNKEEWRPIDGYDGMYEISTEGRARSWKDNMIKTSMNDVDEIRDMHDTGNYTQRQIAIKFGICQQQVSNIVCFKSRNKVTEPKILRLWKNACGRYVTATLYKNGKTKSYLVHRLVAETFIGRIPDGGVVCHKDDVGTNNFLENLYIGTQKDNASDVRKNNNNINVNAKLRIEDVVFIRKMKGIATRKEIVEMLDIDIDVSTVSDIQRRKTWKHIDGGA